MRLKWTPETKALITIVGVWLSLLALVATLMVPVWEIIHRRNIGDSLRFLFWVIFVIGSMWLLLLLGSLYTFIKVAHQSTDSNKATLTKENPVST